MKGIILAGGNGTGLRLLTGALSKQLLPVYDTPMTYYPLAVLMLAGIRDIQIISAKDHLELFRLLLGDGSWIGIRISYAEQIEPRGIAEALLIGEEHIGGDDVALILGDNVFHGLGFSQVLEDSVARLDGCELFGYPVKDPQRYGVGQIDARGNVLSIQERPEQPLSNLAVTGLYFYSNDVIDIARSLRPSTRGELKITDINTAYLDQGRARLTELGRGVAWSDMGTHDPLLHAGRHVQRQDEHIACVEEIALRKGFISAAHCHEIGLELRASSYGSHLIDMAARQSALSGV